MKIIYLNNYHYFNETIIPENPVMVQVGVADGVTVTEFAMKYPSSKIYLYEADPNRDMVVNREDTVFINKAVCGNNRPVNFHVYKNKVSSSMIPRHEFDDNCELVESVKVKGVTINQVMKENKLDRIDLLVLNCEGAELFILDDIIKKKVGEKIAQICVSFHCPRIYPEHERDSRLEKLKETHHIICEPHKEGIPDHLLIRRV